jgi:rod shape determining protein RodA
VQRIYATVGKDYQVDESTLSEADLKKIEEKKKAGNYNVKQSKIAIGSGGFFGKGLLKGTQTRYDFVPEQRTDFIFCTIGEGFGFMGSIILLGLYLFMLFRIINIAERQRSTFSRVYAYGVASVFFFHVFINIGMTLGIVPVIGIPLPFMSYGGTALITFTVLLFILIRLDADRQMILR